MITGKLPKRKHHWSNKFIETKEKGVLTRIRHKQRIEEERRGYIPSFVDSSTVTNFLDREEEQVPVPFTGVRNTLCSFCTQYIDSKNNQLSCHLCPAVAHVRCTEKACNEYLELTEQYRSPKDGEKKNLWFCSLCSKEIALSILNERDRLRADRYRRLEFYAALKLQASCMRHTAQKRYHTLCNGILRLQARVRWQLNLLILQLNTLSCFVSVEVPDKGSYSCKPY